jgi:hypothetical protein
VGLKGLRVRMDFLPILLIKYKNVSKGQKMFV